ncbi:tRNA (N6-threonylcarbamoyladenosine(37)-N6)-methyltransferase TrmO [Mailhella sp.]|uniref:tRNA (N6-threonylcarbamoyladenosine(37)-N6)-methyltransferase TrmO n=1 Tax=Mailhella sp. TaxID=1981029 RepID=UPI0040638857
MNIIAHIHSDLPTKFGVPRQSGLVDALKARIVFTEQYRAPEALRGLEEFTHIWLIWEFSHARREDWSPTVRPPRLGGNRRLGVFATRSPFRPNPIGLSCVKLERVELHTPEGPVLFVAGADLMDGTPIFDIKPYVPYADAHPNASAGFTAALPDATLDVYFPDTWRNRFTEEQQAAITGILERDPRPHYHDDPERIYGMTFAGHDVRFRVEGGTAVVCGIEKL